MRDARGRCAGGGGNGKEGKGETKSDFHLPRNSGKFALDVNGTYFYWPFHLKIPRNNWKIEKVVLFSRWKLSD